MSKDNSNNNNQGQQQSNTPPAYPVPISPRQPNRTEDYQQRTRTEESNVRKK